MQKVHRYIYFPNSTAYPCPVNIFSSFRAVVGIVLIPLVFRAPNAPPSPVLSQVVEGEQVPRMRREREGLQRREVQGSGLPIRQGGELRHVVSVCRVFLFVSNETYIIFEACCTIVGPRWLRIISRVRPADRSNRSPSQLVQGDTTPRRALIG